MKPTSRKPSILHLIKSLSSGGAEANLLNLIKALDRSRYEFFVGYCEGGVLEKPLEALGVRTLKYSRGSHKLKSLASFFIILRLFTFIKRHGIAIVHTHAFNAHVWGGIAAKLAGIKLVEHVHDSRYLESEDLRQRQGMTTQHASIQKVFPLLKGKSDRILVLTRQNEDRLLSEKISTREKVIRFRNGIPLEQTPVKAAGALLRKRLGISDAAGVISTVSRLSPEKNLGLLVEVARLLRQEELDFTFVIVGDGPLREDLEKRITEAALWPVFRLVGYSDDVAAYLAMADIFLLPSLLELHALSILEAMHARIPVVISRATGCHEEFIQDGINGFLVDPREASPWASVVKALLEDPSLRYRIGEAGYMTCQNKFNIRDVARDIEVMYEGLLSSR